MCFSNLSSTLCFCLMKERAPVFVLDTMFNTIAALYWEVAVLIKDCQYTKTSRYCFGVCWFSSWFFPYFVSWSANLCPHCKRGCAHGNEYKFFNLACMSQARKLFCIFFCLTIYAKQRRTPKNINLFMSRLEKVHKM